MKIIRIKNSENLIKMPMYRKLIDVFYSMDAIKRIEIRQEQRGIHVYATIELFDIEDTCELMLDTDNNDVISYTCSCKECNDWNACVHIGTLITTINSLEITELPFVYENPKYQKHKAIIEKEKEARELKAIEAEIAGSRALMESAKDDYANRIHMQLQDENYEITATVEYEYAGTFRISYRVGNDKFYVIKNIEEFLKRIDEGKNFSYGKKLSFVHKLDAFDEDSQRQIAFMRKAVACLHEKQYQNSEYYYKGQGSGRYLSIATEVMDEFFQLYSEIDGENFTCIDSDEPQHVIVEEKKKTILYTWDLKFDAIEGLSNIYAIEDFNSYVITRYPLDEGGKALRFLKGIQKPMAVLKSENEQFYKYVLSDILDYLDIDKIPMIEEKLDLIKLYGDINDIDQIFVKLVYYNEEGNQKKGFDENNITTYTQDLVENIIKKYAQVIDYDAHIAYFDSEGEEIYNFIYTALPMLCKYCEVYVSEALKKLGNTQKYNISVGVHLSNDLLEIDMSSLEIPKNELSEVLRAYRRKRKFFRLKNGKLLSLNSKDLEELNQFVDDYHLPIAEMGNKVQIPSYRMLEMDNDIETKENIVFKRDKQFQEKINNWKQKDASSFSVPSIYQNVLRDYQKEGFVWLSILKDYGFDGILADDMGLGKTLQVMALLESLQGKGTSIVICPASLIYNWDDEVKKFASKLTTCCICGNAGERAAKIHSCHNYDLLITSYDYIRRDVDEYENIEFMYVILDEAQNIKNQKTKNAISVKKLKAQHRLALTGTPIENSLAELWSIFDFLMPNYLYNYHYFQSHYENDIIKNNDENKQQKLKQLVSPFILRRTKKEVLKELPDKIEKNYLIDFNEEEEKLYLAHLAQVNMELQALTNFEGTDKIAILAMLTRLRQLCCEPRLLFENIMNTSSKLNACMELITTLKENNQKVLLFSSFTSMLDLIGEELYKENISYYVLNGQTNKEKRRELVSMFQNDDTSVFLISLKAGGTGLNLTAAEAVIHYDPWWNQSAQNQATDRAHRIGQTKKVQVFKLIMRNSIEEKIQKLQIMKKELADMFVENNEGSISKMSKEQLMELFKMD